MSGGVGGKGSGGELVRHHPILLMLVILGALGISVYLSSRPKLAPPTPPRPYIWSIEIEDLVRLAIALPSLGKQLAWVQGEDRNWYFDTPDGPQVNMKRWGGGVPLLLKRPVAERHIADQATDERLAVYGLTAPNMTIGLTLKNGNTLTIAVGDRTPDRQAYYLRLAGAPDIYTIHYTWHSVFERLVLDPPYP